MSADKIRIRKSILPKVKQWCEALEISESEFAHEALTHYIRFLSGKPTGTNIVEFPNVEQPELEPVSEEIEADNFDGGIAL